MNRTMVVVLAVGISLAVFAPMTDAQATDNLPSLQLLQMADSRLYESPEAIVSGSLDDDFHPTATLIMSTSRTRDLWFRLQLDRDWTSSESLVLSFKGAQNGRVWVYAPPSYEQHALRMMYGDAPPRFSRQALTQVLPKNLRAGQGIYVCVEKSQAQRRIVPTISDLSSYEASDLQYVRLTTLFASVQFAMILSGLCLWLMLRDRLIRYFVVYVSMQLIYSMLASGEIYSLPGGSLFATLGSRASWMFGALSAGFSISFVIEFCHLRRHAPRATAFFGALRWPLFLTAALCLPPLGGYRMIVALTINLLILLASLMAMGIVLVALRKGNRQARFFVIAWMPQIIFTVLHVITLLAGGQPPLWLDYGFPFTMAFASLIVMLGLADQTMHARHERDVASFLANHDPLTGALNRRAILVQLDIAMDNAKLTGQPLALLFVDLDHFKRINDQHGHTVGDRCLQMLVQTLGRELRVDDWLGRYGGEEFIVVLPGATRESAEEIGERLREKIELERSPGNGSTFNVTISIGIAGMLDERDVPSALIERADAALYQAKSNGRNQLWTHPSLLHAVALAT